MRLLLGILCIGAATALLIVTGRPTAGAQTFETSAGPVRVERVAGPFVRPWAVAFLPGERFLVTEKRGRLWHVERGAEATSVAGLPPIDDTGQGGLLDVVAARDFERTREIFLSYVAPEAGGATRTTLAVARLAPDAARLDEVRVIWEQDPAIDSTRHFGSRIVERPDGTLFVTIGDRANRPLAQDRDKSIGKVLRVARDGSIPADNPFVDEPGTKPAIWSLGHRNPQGAALDAEGRLWTAEHGARGGDEVNIPEAGKNYGWPLISYGTHYSGASFPGTRAPGLEQPVHYWDPSIAPSGLAIYSGRLWPQWEGDLFVGALKDRLISRLDREGTRIAGEERLFADVFGRVRDVREGPDGALWFLTDETDGALYRVSPAE